MKKTIALILTLALCLGLLAACGGNSTPAADNNAPAPAPAEATPAPAAEPTPAPSEAAPAATKAPATPAPTPVVLPAEKIDTNTDCARLLTEIPADADAETAILYESRNFKHIQALRPLFEDKSYAAYSKAITSMKRDGTMDGVAAAVQARSDLIQLGTMEDRVWFIWDGSTMPMKDGEEFTQEELDACQMFGYGFEPFAIKYLLEDQSQVKGNIIAVSGGGMMVWSNGSEGYPAAQIFNDLGYNYFLLQRRVRPYSNQDIFMDFQRLVKVVKYHAQKENYGGQDMYAVLGWSGGGGTILGATVNDLYGTLNPTKYDSDYVPDEIDAISSDVDVELVIYGAGYLGNTTYEYLPAFYLSVGSEDGDGPVKSTKLCEDAKALGLPAEVHIVEGAPHGYGVGLPPANGAVPGTEKWPYEADEFMQANRGWQKNRY